MRRRIAESSLAPERNVAPAGIQLTIDGVHVTVEEGTSIWNAARQHGIQIPVLCHQPNERPVGVCRICSVDTGEIHLAAACVRPVEEGMAVRTRSDKVRRARRVLLELLLAEHPSPCVRQQRSGDCELEMLAQAEGVITPRFHSRAAAWGKDNSSLAIAVDREACILCDRCVRACNEVRHNHVLGRKGKGYQAAIAFDLDDPMGLSSCIACGECMVSCPTGALTNRIVIPAELPDGQPADVDFLKGLPYFQDISSTFLKLNRNAVVLRRFRAGETICREGEYGSTAFLILQGTAEMFLYSPGRHVLKNKRRETFFGRLANRWSGRVVDVDPDGNALGIGDRVAFEPVGLKPGNLFGETSCVNHYPRTETVRAASDCVLVEMLRNVLDMMLTRNGEFRKLVDANYRERALGVHLHSTQLFSSSSKEFLGALKEIVELVRFEKGETIFEQGTPADCFYVIRSGFVKISDRRAGGEMVRAYLGPRQHFGLTGEQVHGVTATALDHVDLIRIDADRFEQVLGRFPSDRERFETRAETLQTHTPVNWPEGPDVPLQQFVTHGLMEANSVLILNLEKCTRCDACVRACADAHDGVTRLVREGVRFDKYLIATSCRQCRDPLCMAGCPVGSIRRRDSLEIVIEDWCIGCGLCEKNCPYGNIHMHPVPMLRGDNPFRLQPMRASVEQKAVACDLCSGLAEPSCVYACPHDAAQRVDAVKFFGILPGGQREAIRDDENRPDA